MPEPVEVSNQIVDNLPNIVMAIGALGAASYGVVDGLKLFPWFDLSGFECLFSGNTGGRRWFKKEQQANLDPLFPALKFAYGNQAMDVLKSQYRSGRAKGDLPRTLRQGVRIGLGMMPPIEITQAAYGLGITEETTKLISDSLIKAKKLRPPATGESKMASSSTSLGDEERNALARLETTIDARIDAALLLAEKQYVSQAKAWATLLALSIAFVVGTTLGQAWPMSFLVGISAVPLAPVAKDLATALQEAVKALRKR